ncbi:hypothetical protein RHMOL_Rhmol13G0152400 [Rhododendron molle]|uniref:Uncharacterized protein n=1 Tax=Rhododendron molle TaxID=49168 RepID=A0ACC0L6U9_RHOML|nr:hypothetical protein RHMOL_Rhmol13G0152400 [Rhododendron molle]
MGGEAAASSPPPPPPSLSPPLSPSGSPWPPGCGRRFARTARVPQALSRSSSFVSRSSVPGPAASQIRCASGGVVWAAQQFRLEKAGIQSPWSGGSLPDQAGDFSPGYLLDFSYFCCCIAFRFQRCFIVYGFELWISFDPLLSKPRLVLTYRRYRGACFGSRCLRSTFRLLWFSPVLVLKSFARWA